MVVPSQSVDSGVTGALSLSESVPTRIVRRVCRRRVHAPQGKSCAERPGQMTGYRPGVGDAKEGEKKDQLSLVGCAGDDICDRETGGASTTGFRLAYPFRRGGSWGDENERERGQHRVSEPAVNRN